MTNKFTEWKIKIAEKEVEFWERKQNEANVNLRQNKQKLWELIEKAEKEENE